MTRLILILILCLLAAPARADYVLGNLRFTLFHEFGHAVIDQWRIPLHGLEETAADGFAIVMADRLLPEPEMERLIRAVAASGRTEAVGELHDPWGDYMPTGQRVAHAICVWFGLRPESRGPLARALGMPEGRRRACAELGRSVRGAWAPVFREMTDAAPAGRLRPGGGKTLRLLAKDVARLSARAPLRRDLPLVEEPCGEDNAFYWRYDERIVLCSEMLEALRAAAPVE
jgi:hypothetical protein